MRHWALGAVVVAAVGCSGGRDPAPPVIHARFDPEAKVIPMPTDVLRDDVLGLLDVPIDDDATPAEREFFEFLNGLDGWSSAMQATVEFTGPIDPATVNGQTVQVWQFTPLALRVVDVTVTVDESATKITIDPPREGWQPGGTYVALVRGGAQGVAGAQAEKVECDAAFYFLRLEQPLDVPEHERAFPGDTRAERQDNATKLEDIRRELAPYFDHFAQNGVPREEVAALWKFTITRRVELAMDKSSQRMPLPFDLLLDPATGRVDLPPAAWDSPTVADAKRKLAEYDGFGTSMNVQFEFTGPVDAATVNPQSVKLWKVDGAEQVAADVQMIDDRHAVIIPVSPPLDEQTLYAVTVSTAVRDAGGDPVIPMPVGQFMRGLAPILVDGASQIGAVGDVDAAKVENARARLAPLLDALGRDDKLTGWPFTTMTIRSRLVDLVARAETLQTPAAPADLIEQTPGEAIADFPLSLVSLFQVDKVVQGTIASPVYLDPVTRAFREDGGYEVQPIAFTMTIPESASPGERLPVVIFGHGLMTERRFVLAVADALAQRGFAAVSIDFPYHGTRTACVWSGPICFPDAYSGEEICPDPCQDGTTCAPDGRCVDSSGTGNYLRDWPIVNFPQASGAAFIEVEHIYATRDHFRQAVIDLGALKRSLDTVDWAPLIGYGFDPDRIYYAGQSLGGILGAVWVSLAPDVKRAVLNVPGADTVDMFSSSPAFSAHVELFLQSEGIEDNLPERERFMNVARWFIDAVDPMNQAPWMRGRTAMIQMATLDFIIPNPYTLALQDLTGLPRRDYVAEHAFIVVPVEPEYGRGLNELAGFLAGTFEP
jgi:pimeloyl-ACP methyl ester carboxylesterase